MKWRKIYVAQLPIFSSKLNKKTTRSSATSVDIHWTKWRHVPEDRIFELFPPSLKT
jgi:hypothetical protein